MAVKHSFSVSSPQVIKHNVNSLVIYASPIINNPQYYHYDLIFQLEKTTGTKALSPSLATKVSRINIIVVTAKWLFKNKKWLNSLNGPRVLVEHDAYLNFISGQPYFKEWTRLYKDTSFDLMISSGKKTTERLEAEGIPACWVSKGCNAKMLEMENKFTGNICSFPSSFTQSAFPNSNFQQYSKRTIMGEILKPKKIEPLLCPVAEFSEKLTNYSASCQNDASMDEPMAKHFESSALGCVPIRDEQPELFDLRYDSTSMICYSNFNQLLEIVDFYIKNGNLLTPLQRKTKEIAGHHTWERKAKQIIDFALKI